MQAVQKKFLFLSVHNQIKAQGSRIFPAQELQGPVLLDSGHLENKHSTIL
jgi:hypothetical protein